jgi:hypothetical protein
MQKELAVRNSADVGGHFVTRPFAIFSSQTGKRAFRGFQNKVSRNVLDQITESGSDLGLVSEVKEFLTGSRAGCQYP